MSLIVWPATWLSIAVAARFAVSQQGLSSWQVLALMALAFASIVLFRGDAGWTAASVGIVLAWSLTTLAVIDLAIFRLPDALTWPLAVAGLAAAWAGLGPSLGDGAVGAAAGYGALAATGWAYRRLRGREGLGLGDAKLLAVAGAWLGWRALPAVVLIACGVAFVMVGWAWRRRGRSALTEPLAFGAPLALAIWVGWIVGPDRLAG